MTEQAPTFLKQKRILLTGVQGLIGWNLYNFLMQGNNVIGFSKTKRSMQGEWYEGLLEDYRYVSEILERHDPEIVIHAQAMCNLDLCEIKPEKTRLINVEATERLLEALDPKRHQLVYISSDHIFSGRGKDGNYNEEDAPDPVSVYGHTRVAAEKLVRSFPGALIIRPGLVIGKSLQGNIGPHDWLLSRLAKNQVASYFVDEIRSPLRAEKLMLGIENLIAQKAQGTYHLGGATRLSRYEITQILLQQWGRTGDIRSKRIQDDLEVPRIGNCSLDSSKAQPLGWIPPAFS